MALVKGCIGWQTSNKESWDFALMKVFHCKGIIVLLEMVRAWVMGRIDF